MNKYSQRTLRELTKFRTFRSFAIGTYNTFRKNPEIECNPESNFQLLDVERTVGELRSNALSNVFSIDSVALQKILNDCNSQLAYPSLKYDGTPILNGKGKHIDVKNPSSFQKDCIWFSFKNIGEWSSVQNIVKDPKLINVAKGYLGNNPIVRSQYIWWSFPAKNEQDEDYDSPRYWFHYDIDDLKFLKIFIYLNDVDAETGPHLVVKNTHKSKPLKYKLNRRVESSDLEGFFEGKEIVELTGKKGTSFFEDTFTYHNGTPPKKPRLVLQIEYSLTKMKLG